MPRHTLVLPNEAFTASMTHFLTLTLKPELYTKTARQQFRQSQPQLLKLLKAHCEKFFCVSELTKECNIHYHVALKLEPLMYEDVDLSDMHFLNSLKTLKSFGFKKLEKLASEQKTYEYLTKDLKRTFGLLNPNDKTLLDVWTYWVKPARIPKKEILNTQQLDPNPKLGEFDDWDDAIAPTPKKQFK